MNLRTFAVLVCLAISLRAYDIVPHRESRRGIRSGTDAFDQSQKLSFGSYDPRYSGLQRRAGKLRKGAVPASASSKKLGSPKKAGSSKKQTSPQKLIASKPKPKPKQTASKPKPKPTAFKTKPISSKPASSKPASLGKPVTSKLVTSKPVASKPVASKPTSSKTGFASSATTKLAASPIVGASGPTAGSKCSAQTCSGTKCLLSKKPKALSRRNIDLPTSEAYMDDWVKAEVKSAEAIASDPTGSGFNTATYRLLGSEPVDLAVEGLKGCTSLVIVSHQAVYFTHWWENISFDQDPEWVVEGEDTHGAFKRTVLNAMEHGNQRNSKESHAPLRSTKFPDGHAKAFLIRPSDPFKNTPEWRATYEKKWKDTMDYVSKKIPGLEWGEPYVYDRNQRNTARTALGKAVFKYDPDHYGKKKAILVTERTVRYNEEW